MPARDEQGFTRVEMQVSLALRAMAALLMLEGFSASHGAWRRLQAREEAGESVSSAQQRLRDRLEQMAPRALFDTATPYVDIEGDANAVEFGSGPPIGEAPAATVRDRLALDRAGDLILSPLAHVDDTAPEDVLLHGVARLDLSYFGSGPDGQRSWREDWSHEPAPPELVRVRVGFVDGDRRVWPDLIVRVASMVDADCVLDADRATCRGRA